MTRRPRLRSCARLFLALLLMLVGTVPVCGQQPVVKTGLSRDTIRVGDPFRAVISIDLPRGSDMTLPDSLQPTEDIENAGKVRMRRDSTNGSMRIVAAYPLTAWRPGSLALPDLSVVLRMSAGERHVQIKLPAVPVLSVLPQDTAGIKPKPPKDVIGGNRLWWPWILAGALLLAALAAAYWWWRTHRRAHAVAPDIVPAIMPRARALAELARIRELGLAEEGLYKRYYTLVTEVLRQYLATVEPAWSTDLTTAELARKVRGHAEVAPVVAVLKNSDLVKFARQTPGLPDALRDFDCVHDFVRAYPPAPAAETVQSEAA